MPTMLEYLLYLILCIVIYQYWVWYYVLAMVFFQQCYVEYRIFLYPWW